MTREKSIIYGELIKMDSSEEDARLVVQGWMTEVKLIVGFEMSLKTYKRYLKEGKVHKWAQNGWEYFNQSDVDTKSNFVVLIRRFNTYYVCVVQPNM